MADTYHPSTAFPNLRKQPWPRESHVDELHAFYGDPDEGQSVIASQLTTVEVPWTGKKIQVHQKAAASLERILNAFWDHVGRSQDTIAQYHLSDVGTYNPRRNVNAPSKWSLHAYGAAIDLASNENPNGRPWEDNGRMLPRPLIDAFLAEGWCWGGDFNSTKDPMHFQATFNAHADAPGDQEQPASIPTVVVPSVFSPAPAIPVAPTDHLSRIRKFMIEEAGINKDLDAAKSSWLKQLDALKTEIQTFQLGLELPAEPPPTPGSPTPPTTKPPVVVPPTKKFMNVHATCFGGSLDPNTSAYDGHLINDTELTVSLPGTFKKPPPFVVVEWGGKQLTCAVGDKGPWNWTDSYWDGTGVPRAITQRQQGKRADNGHIPNNDAGIDLAPGVVMALGAAHNVHAASQWSGTVNWWFVTPAAKPQSSGGTKAMGQNRSTTMNAITGSPFTSITGIIAILPTLADLVTSFSTKNWGQIGTDVGIIFAGLGLVGASDHKTATGS